MQKKEENKLKYKSLCMEIRRMWNMKCMIIQVITGATGMAITGSKSFESHTRKTFDRFTTKYSCT
jgi:hypothetical protein